VVPNAIRTFCFSKVNKSGGLRRQLSIPDYADVMIFVGRITQYKRPDIAVDTLGTVHSLGRETHLVIVGPDEDGIVQQLQNQAQSLGCEDKLHFSGLLNREAVISALAEADLLLVPTEIQENFGMSALEAMAAGVPILVSEGIPVGRLAQMAGAGRVAPCTKEAFQQAALELLSRPEELKIMSQRGQDLVRQHFDSKFAAHRMLAQYRAIVSTGKPLPSTEFSLRLI
jgi:glycosyltransferase involved in cell wall biosynthesis